MFSRICAFMSKRCYGDDDELFRSFVKYICATNCYNPDLY